MSSTHPRSWRFPIAAAVAFLLCAAVPLAASMYVVTVKCGEEKRIYVNGGDDNQRVHVQATDDCPVVDSGFDLGRLDRNGNWKSRKKEKLYDGTTGAFSFDVHAGEQLWFQCNGGAPGSCTYQLSFTDGGKAKGGNSDK